MVKLFWFLVLFFGGLATIIYRERLQRFTGNFAFAEKYLGSGGTFNFYILLGFLFIFIGVAYVSGTLDSVITGTLGRFFPTPGD